MIYGYPGTSLAHGTFGTTRTRAVGAAGERLTAAILNGFAYQAAIFHDLHVPGFEINADHAVLAGNRLMLIDTKVWAWGRYWSVGGLHFHGLKPQRIPPTKGVEMAREVYTSFMRPYGVTVVTPLVVLWSGSQAGRGPWLNTQGVPVGCMSRHEARPFIHYRYPGGKAIPGNDLHRRVLRFTHHAKAPDPAALEALRHQLF